MKVAVLVVHGIGWSRGSSTDDGFVDRWVTKLMDPPTNVRVLKEGLAGLLKDVDHEIALAHWGTEIEPVQQQFRERYGDLRGGPLRKFVISALGDAAQYDAAVYSGKRTTFPTHAKIHEVVASTLAGLARTCGRDAPLVVIGHSLGAHILSNHIYDQQRSPPRHAGTSSLERMETLRGFVTLGANIPLFVMGASELRPIALPRGAKWLNYYDPDDILGYPLLPLYFPNGKPDDYPLEDILVEVGGFPLGSTPVSHGYYWTKDAVLDGIAGLIRAASAG